MNKFIGIGNIATDLELKQTNNGNAVVQFNLAINDRDDTVFIPVEVYKRQAENLVRYQKKGSKVAVEGSIKIDKWEKDGQKRSFTKVLAFNVQFLDSKGQTSQNQEKAHTGQNLENERFQPTDDDLPF